MKPTTRDNIIYLGVGLGIAALVTFDFFYADSRGKEMWMPSEFAFHVVAYMGILGYFVATETRKVKATFMQTALCVVAASILHLGVAFGFRQTYAGGLSFGLYGLALLEFFLIVQLMVQSISYLRSRTDAGS